MAAEKDRKLAKMIRSRGHEFGPTSQAPHPARLAAIGKGGNPGRVRGLPHLTVGLRLGTPAATRSSVWKHAAPGLPRADR